MNEQNQIFTSDPYTLRNKNYVCRFLCSPVILALGILNAIEAIISIVSNFLTRDVSEEFASALTHLLEDYLDEELTTTSSFSIPIVPIVMAIGFFVMYFSAKTGDKNDGAKSGSTILWVLAIITLVACSVAAVALLLVIIALALAIPYITNNNLEALYDIPFRFTGDVRGVLMSITIVFIVIFSIIITILLIYGISQFRFASSVRKSLSTPELTAKGARTYGVLSVISSVFSGIGLLGTAIGFFAILTLPDTFIRIEDIYIQRSSLVSVSGISLLTSALSFAYNIYMAKYAFGYHRHIAAAGPNGVNLPMPVIAYAAPVKSVYSAPAQPSESIPVQPEETKVEDVPYAQGETQDDAPPAFCPECGTPVVTGQLFCAECGTKVTSE